MSDAFFFLRFFDSVSAEAWESREIMLKYLRSGAHLKAMKAFKQIATGPTYGYESESIPSWDEAYALLTEKGTMH